MVVIWRFLSRSIGFFVFPVPAVGGTFSPLFIPLLAVLYF
jgi:hypothetical protein